MPSEGGQLTCSGSDTAVIIFLRKIPLLAVAFALLFWRAPRRRDAAEASITVDAKTGFILEKFQADKKRQIGSVTKIATAMVVLDWAAKAEAAILLRSRSFPRRAFAGTSENNIGFQPGDTVTLRDLLYAALVQSDNVAAYTLAESRRPGTCRRLSRQREAARGTPADYFVLQMNALAQHLGMSRTRFLNPSGSRRERRNLFRPPAMSPA